MEEEGLAKRIVYVENSKSPHSAQALRIEFEFL